MKENFKILFLINKFKRGGAERAFANQINELKKRGYDVYLGMIYDFARDNSYLSELDISEDKVKNFNFKYLFDFKKFLSLKKFIQDNEIDIIYSTLESANIIARLLKIIFPRLKIKVVIRESGMADRKKYRYKILDFWLNFFTDRIISVSEEVKRSLLNYEKVHEKKIEIIENGVPVKSWDEINKKRAILRTGKEEKFTVLNVGSMNNKNKGQEKILNIFKELEDKKSMPHCLLVLAGDGILKTEYADFIRKNNLDDKVVFPGQLDSKKLEQYYLAADLFILHSENEGCPNVVLEAMACGLPVISTIVGGVKKVIEDGKTGFLIERTKPRKTGELILTMARNSELRNNMAYNAYTKVNENYSIQKTTQRLISLFNNL